MSSCPRNSDNVVPLFPGLIPLDDPVAAGVGRVRHAMAELMCAAIGAEDRVALALTMDIRAAIEEYEAADQDVAPVEIQGR